MKVVYFILLDDPRVLFAFPVQLFNLETENVLVCILGLKTTYHLSDSSFYHYLYTVTIIYPRFWKFLFDGE